MWHSFDPLLCLGGEALPSRTTFGSQGQGILEESWRTLDQIEMPHQMGMSSCSESALNTGKMIRQFETTMSIQPVLFMCPIKRGLHIISCVERQGFCDHAYHTVCSSLHTVAVQSQESRRAGSEALAVAGVLPDPAGWLQPLQRHPMTHPKHLVWPADHGRWRCPVPLSGPRISHQKLKPRSPLPPRSSRKRRRDVVLLGSESLVWCRQSWQCF